MLFTFRWSLNDSGCTSCSVGGHALEVGDITVTSAVTLGTELCILLVQQEIFLFLWLTAALWLISYKESLSAPSWQGFQQSLAVVSAPQQTKQT